MKQRLVFFKDFSELPSSENPSLPEHILSVSLSEVERKYLLNAFQDGVIEALYVPFAMIYVDGWRIEVTEQRLKDIEIAFLGKQWKDYLTLQARCGILVRG